MVRVTSDEDPRKSWVPLRTESSLGSGDRNGYWLKPFLEKPAEAGSAPHVARGPGRKVILRVYVETFAIEERPNLV